MKSKSLDYLTQGKTPTNFFKKKKYSFSWFKYRNENVFQKSKFILFD